MYSTTQLYILYISLKCSLCTVVKFQISDENGVFSTTLPSRAMNRIHRTKDVHSRK